jgi:hypothetical protein
MKSSGSVSFFQTETPICASVIPSALAISTICPSVVTPNRAPRRDASKVEPLRERGAAYPKSEFRNPFFFGFLLVAIARFQVPPPQLQGAIRFPALAISSLPHELHWYHWYRPDRLAFDPDFGMVLLSSKPISQHRPLLVHSSNLYGFRPSSSPSSGAFCGLFSREDHGIRDYHIGDHHGLTIEPSKPATGPPLARCLPTSKRRLRSRQRICGQNTPPNAEHAHHSLEAHRVNLCYPGDDGRYSA